MQNFGKLLGGFIIASALMTPFVAGAQFGQFLPFGGRVVSSVPCASAGGASLWVTIVPFGLPGTIPFSFIWSPLTLSVVIPPLPSIPPTHAGEQIVGTYVPFAYMPCFIGKFPVFGWSMLTENNSAPSGGF